MDDELLEENDSDECFPEEEEEEEEEDEALLQRLRERLQKSPEEKERIRQYNREVTEALFDRMRIRLTEE